MVWHHMVWHHINFSSTHTQAQRLEEENRIRIEEDRRAAAALARDTFMLGNVGKNIGADRPIGHGLGDIKLLFRVAFPV